MLQVRKQGLGGDAWYNPERDIANLLPAVFKKILIEGGKEEYLKEYLSKANIDDENSKALHRVALTLGAFITLAPSAEDFESLLISSKFNEIELDARTSFLAALGIELLKAFFFGIGELSKKDSVMVTDPGEIAEYVEMFEKKLLEIESEE
jgi:hypothetical protein